MTSWYSINISLQSNGNTIFNGYFNVDNTTNLILSFYETINGNTYNNNILISTETGTPETTYLGFQVYNNQTNGYSYDNAYLSTWYQFDYYGIILNSISAYPQINQFNLCATNISEESINNIGYLNADNVNNYDVLYTITPSSAPILVPVPMTCFKEDTKILTDKGYIPIQHLRKGDLVKTLKDNYCAIDMIGKRDIYHISSTERIKDQLYKCSTAEFGEVFEDLIITGCHSILVDRFENEFQKEKVKEINGNTYITDGKYRLPACTDHRTSIYEIPGTYTIYHIALEHNNYYMNYGIYANGLLVESCSKRMLKECSNMVLIE